MVTVALDPGAIWPVSKAPPGSVHVWVASPLLTTVISVPAATLAGAPNSKSMMLTDAAPPPSSSAVPPCRPHPPPWCSDPPPVVVADPPSDPLQATKASRATIANTPRPRFMFPPPDCPVTLRRSGKEWFAVDH